MIDIVPLTIIDPAAIETLLDDAFGADRHARTAYKIREGTAWLPALSFAAVSGDGTLIGTLQSWQVALHTPDGAQHPITLVGPVAVLPVLQRSGTGRAMMAAMLQVADAGLCDAMVMIGDPEYYDRFFGFSAKATSGWEVPGPVDRRRLLARISRAAGLPAIGKLGPLHRGVDTLKQSHAAQTAS